MKAETTRRPLLPACARALRMKWTRQRCQVALSTLATAALMPSWASEITSLTPRRPRRASLRRKPVQNVLATGGAGQRTNLQLHQTLGGKADHLPQKVGIRVFSTSARRFIISSVIAGSSVAVEFATQPYRWFAMTTAKP